MEAPAACEIERLPEDLLVHVISLTSPGDAFRAAAVSRAFHAAADSDTVWSRFLPGNGNLPRFAKGELPRTPTSKKQLFRRLSGQPALLQHKIMGMQLDRATGAQSLTISARALQISTYPLLIRKKISWDHAGLVPVYSERDYSSIFKKTARFHYFEKLEIRAEIHRKVLSDNKTYGAYMVFKFKLAQMWMWHGQSAAIQAMPSIGVAGSKSTRQVFMQGYVEEGGDAIPSVGENVRFPRKRADGWMEVELGEFDTGEGDADDMVSISFVETSEGRQNDIILLGIEIRSSMRH